MKPFKILLVLALTIFSFAGFAQTKPATKFKPPQLFTQLGTYRDSVQVTVAEAEALTSQTLKIFDGAKGTYTVSSYIFIYKKIGVTEDEQTGKVSPTSNIVANTFKVTPLPQVWIDQVRDQVKAGDELHFVDVIAKNSKGQIMYAPNLKLIVR
jgi:hypothetical protein